MINKSQRGNNAKSKDGTKIVHDRGMFNDNVDYIICWLGMRMPAHCWHDERCWQIKIASTSKSNLKNCQNSNYFLSLFVRMLHNKIFRNQVH